MDDTTVLVWFNVSRQEGVVRVEMQPTLGCTPPFAVPCDLWDHAITGGRNGRGVGGGGGGSGGRATETMVSSGVVRSASYL